MKCAYNDGVGCTTQQHNSNFTKATACEFDVGEMDDLQATIGAGLIVIGGVSVIAVFLFCLYLRCRRRWRDDDEDDDIEKGWNKKNIYIGRKDRGESWKDKHRRQEEKKRMKEKEKKKSSAESTDSSEDARKQKRKRRKDESDDTGAIKKSKKEKAKKIEKKIEKKLIEKKLIEKKLNEKIDKKIEKIVDKKIEKKSEKKKKKRRDDRDSDSDISRSRRSSSHRTRSSRSRRSPRRRRYEEHRSSRYYDRDRYYYGHRRHSVGSRPMYTGGRDLWHSQSFDHYSMNDSSSHAVRSYPRSIVTQSTASESLGSWDSGYRDGGFLGSPIKPLRSSGATLPTEIADLSLSSYSERSGSDSSNFFEEDVIPSSSMDDDSLSNFLVKQLSLYRSMKTKSKKTVEN